MPPELLQTKNQRAGIRHLATCSFKAPSGSPSRACRLGIYVMGKRHVRFMTARGEQQIMFIIAARIRVTAVCS